MDDSDFPHGTEWLWEYRPLRFVKVAVVYATLMRVCVIDESDNFHYVTRGRLVPIDRKEPPHAE